jgi:uncharacterized SAM-binding protein YcdF (DUF218 family)
LGCGFGCVGLFLALVVIAVLGYRARAAWLPLLGHVLEVPAVLRPVDVIIVLGGGNGDRDVYASQLYQRGLAAHVIATGGPVGTDTAAVGLLQRGVPRTAIVLANGTQNTRGDALRSEQLMAEYHWQSALLVTDPYHMRRSLWTFRTAFAGPRLTVWPAPVVGGWFDADHWWQSEEGFVDVDDEYLKLIYYVAHGYIRASAAIP